MNFWELATYLWPSWLLGIGMIVATYKTDHKDLIRIEWEIVLKCIKLLAFAFIIRLAFFWACKLLGFSGAHSKAELEPVFGLPWQVILFVFWEDAAHGLPLILLDRLLPKRWYFDAIRVVALTIVMLSFGSGHLYQGLFGFGASIAYLLFATLMGKRYGFGTVMIGHTLYDLSTIGFLRLIWGWM